MATIQMRPGRGGQVRYRVQIRLRGQGRSELRHAGYPEIGQTAILEPAEYSSW
jgi:hypothetical protein